MTPPLPTCIWATPWSCTRCATFRNWATRSSSLIGDFTGRIGDPSGRSETRPPLTEEQVIANAETYKKQVFKILDPEKTIVEFNSHWLGKMDASDFIRLASSYRGPHDGARRL